MSSTKRARNARVGTRVDNARHAPKNKSQAQRERQLAEIAKRYLRGVTQHEIADALGIAQSQVAYDLKILSKRWKESGLRDFNEAKSHELAKIDALEREYWNAWEASKGTKQKRRTRGDASGTLQNVAIESYDDAGDPRYLNGVQWCIEQRCKILKIGTDIKLRTWRDEVIDLLKARAVTPQEVVEEVGDELARELFVAAGVTRNESGEITESGKQTLESSAAKS